MKNRVCRIVRAHVRAIIKVVVATAALATSVAAVADDFPSMPIRIITPAPAGGGTDAMSRLIANALSESVKWTVVVENVPGAGGNIGLDKTFKAPKDGYTLAMGEPSNMIVNQFLYKSIPFNIEQD